MIKTASSALLQILIVLIGIGWLLNSGAQTMGYQWQWSRIPQYILVFDEGEWWSGELVDGLIVTLKISVISLVFTLVIGLSTALMRLSSSILARYVARGYVELIRNTPLLVQIYLLYFVFGPVIGLERFSTAVLALSLFQGAYTAEIIRSGLNQIPRGQFEASVSLGLSPFFTYKDVILPQVIQAVLPPLTNEMVSLIKNSSIVSVMAIFDLTTQGRNIVSETAMPFEVWFTVAGIYLVLTLTLSAITSWLERRMGIRWKAR